jgi:hypothetical protein
MFPGRDVIVAFERSAYGVCPTRMIRAWVWLLVFAQIRLNGATHSSPATSRPDWH